MTTITRYNFKPLGAGEVVIGSKPIPNLTEEAFKQMLCPKAFLKLEVLSQQHSKPFLNFANGSDLYYLALDYHVNSLGEPFHEFSAWKLARQLLYIQNVLVGNLLEEREIDDLANGCLEALITKQKLTPARLYNAYCSEVKGIPREKYTLSVEHPFTLTEGVPQKETLIVKKTKEVFKPKPQAPPVDQVDPSIKADPIVAASMEAATGEVFHASKVAEKAISQREGNFNAALKRNAELSLADKRTVLQKHESMHFYTNLTAVIDDLEKQIPEGQRDSRFSALCKLVINHLVAKYTLEEFHELAQKFGYSNKESYSVVMAFVSGYVIVKTDPEYADETMCRIAMTAVDRAMIYPPPKHPISEAYANELKQKFQIRTLTSPIAAKAVKTEKEIKMSTSESTQAAENANNSSAAEAVHTATAAADMAQASAAATAASAAATEELQREAIKATDAAASVAAEADRLAEKAAAMAEEVAGERQPTFAELVAWTLKSMIFGALIGASAYFTVTILVGFLTGLGLAGFGLWAVVGSITVVAMGVIAWGINKAVDWVSSWFEKSEKAEVAEPKGQAAPAAAAT